MSSGLFLATQRRMRLFLLTSLTLALPDIANAAGNGAWATVYRDNYNYAAQTATFNTWFWREDSTATHDFNVTSDAQGCTSATPCVKLTAKALLANPAYTNAEMYNNSCVQNAALDALSKSPWGVPLQNQILYYCGIPYPYRLSMDPAAPAGVTTSWANGTTLAFLEPNPLALTPFDAESAWKSMRDVAFNNPYLAHGHTSLRITTEIRAVTQDQGGSRGWGFWNTTMDPTEMQLAWFMEYSTPQEGSTPPKHQVQMQTVRLSLTNPKELVADCTALDASIDIYQWHRYQIVWTPIGVRYLVDGNDVAYHTAALTRHMAFHNWVDNRNYGGSSPANYPLTQDKANYIRAFLVESQLTAIKTSPAESKTAAVKSRQFVIKASDVKSTQDVARQMAWQCNGI